MAEWSFLTNHARVLVCIAHDPGVRLRDIATTLDITERSAYSIVTDLTEGGYVVKDKDGRRNRYQIQPHLPLREAITQERTIGEVLDVLVDSKFPANGDEHRVTRPLRSAHPPSRRRCDRIAAVGRRLDVESRPGDGTRVRGSAPRRLWCQHHTARVTAPRRSTWAHARTETHQIVIVETSDGTAAADDLRGPVNVPPSEQSLLRTSRLRLFRMRGGVPFRGCPDPKGSLHVHHHCSRLDRRRRPGCHP